MKKLFPFLLALLIALPAYGGTKATALTADTAPAATDIIAFVKDPASTKLDRQLTFGNLTKALTLANFPASANVVTMLGSANNAAILSNIGAQPSLGVLAGTLTNTYLCTYTSSGTLLACNTNPATFQAALTYPITGVASPSAGYLMKWGASGNTAVDGLKFGTMTATKVCTWETATGLTCTTDATTASVSDTAYDASSWDGVTTIAPSKNAVRDYLESRMPAGSDGGYGIIVNNNSSSWTPGAGTYGFGFAGGVPQVDINNTQYSIPYGPSGKQISFTGPTSAHAYALPDAAATLLYSGGALGTPASGTLTNATGLPIAGLTASTSTALGVGSIELGHASDTTLSRSAGGVMAVEGKVVPRIIVSGTKALATSSISSGACTAAQDAGTATGVATTDIIDWGFNADPTGITGFGPSATGGLFIYAYPTADHISFKVCNNTAGAITPGAMTLNWRVTR